MVKLQKSILFIFTDRVRSTTGRLCFDTCLSVCSQEGGLPQRDPAGGGVPLAGMGYLLARSDGGTQGGVPPAGIGHPLRPGPTRGVLKVGVPLAGMGYPLARSDGGYPRWGTPSRDWVPPGWTWPEVVGWGTLGRDGVSPARSDGGTRGGVPPSRDWVPPQARSNQGGTRGGVPLAGIGYPPLARSDGGRGKKGGVPPPPPGVPPPPYRTTDGVLYPENLLHVCVEEQFPKSPNFNTFVDEKTSVDEIPGPQNQTKRELLM